MSFSLSSGAASTFYDRRANLYGAPRVGIFKAETSHIPGNEAPVYLGIISPVDRFFLQTQRVLLLISLVSDRRVFPFSFTIPPRHSSHPTFLHTMHFLLGSCLLTSFFFLVARTAWVARRGTVVYFSPYRAPRSSRTWPRFRAHVSKPVKFRRRVVYRADEFALRGYGPFVVSDTWRRGDTYAKSTQRDRPHLIPEVL